jgi:hypothetical protein
MREWIRDGQAGDKRRVVARAAVSLAVAPSWSGHGEDGSTRTGGTSCDCPYGQRSEAAGAAGGR